MRVNGTTKLIKDRCGIEKLLNKKEKVDEEVNSGYITDNSPYPATKSIINQFNNQVDNNSKFNILITDFFNEYFEYLKHLKLNLQVMSGMLFQKRSMTI